MEMEEIYQLISHFQDTKLTKLKLETPGWNVAMEKSVTENVTTAAKTEEKELLSVEKPEKAAEIKAPLAGTFYTSSAPGEKAFVKPGDHVKKGQIIGIIEAMKLMNEIEAPADGEILSIECENEEMVSFGQTLIRLREFSYV